MKLSQIRDFVEQCTEIDISIKTRQRSYVYARAVYFYLARNHTSCGVEAIADSMDVHHTSVLHSLKKIIPIIFKYDNHLASVCKNFKKEYKHFVNNTKKAKQDLIDENINLKSEIIKYKIMIEDMNEKHKAEQEC
tara:strand:- start:1162 stop:1566 length:405 start_codon:yes stop_codon:yes gene_type:complete